MTLLIMEKCIREENTINLSLLSSQTPSSWSVAHSTSCKWRKGKLLEKTVVLGYYFLSLYEDFVGSVSSLLLVRRKGNMANEKEYPILDTTRKYTLPIKKFHKSLGIKGKKLSILTDLLLDQATHDFLMLPSH